MNLEPNSVLVKEVSWVEMGKEIASIRRRVFVEEQGVPPELEWDGQDEYAFHVLAFSNGQALATGRLLPNGHLGRMAVLRELRGRGIGSQVLQTLLALARREKIGPIFLHAQLSARSFYMKYGFRACGEIFGEAGIAHIRMELTPLDKS